MAEKYERLAELPYCTVLNKFLPKERRAKTYESEEALEAAFVRILVDSGYEQVCFGSEMEMLANVKKEIERLNNVKFSDEEWKYFCDNYLCKKGDSVQEKCEKIQVDYIFDKMRWDNKRSKNIKIFDKENLHSNHLQVMRQYSENNGNYESRYDVTILLNGIPVVHSELKRRGVSIREAFNQINRYQKDSFWASSGLFQYVQIFIISNGTKTRYYSNTTRLKHIERGQNKKISAKTSDSYEFTSTWSDAANNPIDDLMDFAESFLYKNNLLAVLAKYCVYTVEKTLIVLRPYQIAAVEAILRQVNTSHYMGKFGTKDAGGYIWHATASGKTLTSFKTAQLLANCNDFKPFIKKVVFVVDRKDLDAQTIEEYEKFQKGSVSHSSDTKHLTAIMDDNSKKVVITTIQKLSRFVKQNKRKKSDIFNSEIVFIFDECHRSQFGEMHKEIKKAFKKHYMFGFTGTPIFAENSNKGKNSHYTTDFLFGVKLHQYTLSNAITDKKVLPFHIEYYNTLKGKIVNGEEKVEDIDTKEALEDPARISKVVKNIFDTYNRKTKRNESYSYKGRKLHGFNGMLAVESISMAKKYYAEFKKQNESKSSDKEKLIVATIFSFVPNGDEYSSDILEDHADFDTSNWDLPSKDFLSSAIQDYNKMFGTNFDISSKEFENYYRDLSKRVKNKEVDLLIVVNMFLTGFDATTLNTLWVDKKLEYHNLIQAFGRTNRILNDIKSAGNIVCYRNLQDEVNAALALFGSEENCSIVLMRTFDEYMNGYQGDDKYHKGYKELALELYNNFPIGKQIRSDEEKKEFVRVYGSILRTRNILNAFSEFADCEENNPVITMRDLQDYQSIYIEFYNEFRKRSVKERINDDIEFEMELVKQIDVGYDYIQNLLAFYSNNKSKEVIAEIKRCVNSSQELRSKKQLIEKFIEQLNINPKSDLPGFIKMHFNYDVGQLIKEENLDEEKTFEIITNALKSGIMIRKEGTTISNLIPPHPFGSERTAIIDRVHQKILCIVEKYNGVY